MMTMEKSVTKKLKVIAALFCAVLFLFVQACGTAPISETASSERVFDDRAYKSALELMKNKKYEKAVTRLEEVIRSDNRRSGPYINLGIAYRQLGKLKEAKQALRVASQRRAGSAIAYNELGIVYRKLGEFKNAKEAYKKSIRRKSRYEKAYLNLGILCDIYLQDLSCAIRNYEKFQKVSKVRDKQVSLWIVDAKRRAGKKSRKK